jgi:uncharacterized protein (DUF924 family)
MPDEIIVDTPARAVAFWRNAGRKAWFSKDPEFDREIRSRFHDLHMAASRGELGAGVETAEDALGLLLLLDQFPRNMFRGSAHAFATDPLARTIARLARERRYDAEVEGPLRPFFQLPFAHSEDAADQSLSVEIAEELAAQGDADALKWAKIHRDIILRFGRFPHRNACLGRRTTVDEQAFLDGGGFAG